MRYVIVTTEWCAARGILLTPEMRKSLDGLKVVLHANFVGQYLSEEEKSSGDFKAYAFDDAEFQETLASPDWTPAEGSPVDPSVTSDYGVVAGILNAEKSVKAGIQAMGLTDTESLKVKELYPEWESKMGQQVNAGTKEDPIPYGNNMELEEGKHYSQDGVTYICTRDTGIPVYNPLADLVGIYVEVAA